MPRSPSFPSKTFTSSGLREVYSNMGAGDNWSSANFCSCNFWPCLIPHSCRVTCRRPPDPPTRPRDRFTFRHAICVARHTVAAFSIPYGLAFSNAIQRRPVIAAERHANFARADDTRPEYLIDDDDDDDVPRY